MTTLDNLHECFCKSKSNQQIKDRFSMVHHLAKAKAKSKHAFVGGSAFTSLRDRIQLKVIYFLYFNVTKFCDIKNRSKYPQKLPRSTCLHCKKKCILWVYVSEMSLVLLTFSFRNCSFTFWSCFLRLAFSCCRFSTCQRGKKQTLLYVPNVILHLISLASLSVWFVKIA